MTSFPSPVLAWVEGVVGPGARVRSVREMDPWSVQMHELIVEDRDGADHRLVLRRYTDERHLGTDPS